MRIIPPSQFKTTPWKNLGGITHEIAKEETADGLIWRLSVAEVDTDGPFSQFDGLTRVLTVIEGAGLKLIHPDGIIEALPGRPVRFSGDLPVNGQRIDGKVRDLNVIFDANKVAVTVDPLTSDDTVAAQPAADRSFALYCVTGMVSLGASQELVNGAVALFSECPAPITFGPRTTALLVTMDRRGIRLSDREIA